MRLAIPVETARGLKSRISAHFGRAKKFLLIEFESGKTKTFETLDPPAHAFGAFPQFLADLGVEIVVCQNIGEKAKELLENLGIFVFSGFSGSVEKALAKLEPEISRIEEERRGEEEKRKKAREALEKARERMVNFWIILPENGFIFRVLLLDDLSLLFDLGMRKVILQKKVEDGQPGDIEGQPEECMSLHFYGTRLVKKDKIVWTNLEGKEIIAGEVWENIWEDDLPPDVGKRLEELVGQFNEDLDKLDKARIRELNDYLKDLVERYKRVWENVGEGEQDL